MPRASAATASVETSSVSPSVSRSSSPSPRFSCCSGCGSGTGHTGRLDELAACYGQYLPFRQYVLCRRCKVIVWPLGVVTQHLPVFEITVVHPAWKRPSADMIVFGDIRNSEPEAEVRIPDFRWHFHGASQSHCIPCRSLASRSTIVIPRAKFLLEPVRTNRHRRPPVSYKIHTSSVGCSSTSAILYTANTLSISGHSSCNVASTLYRWCCCRNLSCNLCVRCCKLCWSEEK